MDLSIIIVVILSNYFRGFQDSDDDWIVPLHSSSSELHGHGHIKRAHIQWIMHRNQTID